MTRTCSAPAARLVGEGGFRGYGSHGFRIHACFYMQMSSMTPNLGPLPASSLFGWSLKYEPISEMVYSGYMGLPD